MRKVIMNKSLDYSAILWNILFWKVLYIKPILLFYENKSKIILLGLNIALLGIYIIFVLTKRIYIKIDIGYIFLLIIFCIFFFNILFYSNEYVNNYFYKFLSNSILLILFFLSIKDYQYFLKFYSICSIIAILLYGIFPFLNGISIFSDYMDFGYSIALPSFLGVYLLRRYFGLKFIFPLELLCWSLIIIFSSRGAILCGIMMIVLYNIYVENNGFKKTLLFVFVFFLLILFFIFLSDIFNLLYIILDKINYNSRTINKMKDLLIYKNTTNILSNRDIILSNAVNQIKLNFLFGSGIGYFETLFNTYSHNFIIDFVLYWGSFGIIFLSWLFYLWFGLLRNNDVNKAFILLFLCLWFPKLLYTGSFLYDSSFWIFSIFSIRYKVKRTVIYE